MSYYDWSIDIYYFVLYIHDCLCQIRALPRNLFGMSTRLQRKYSARFFPRMSYDELADTPRSR